MVCGSTESVSGINFDSLPTIVLHVKMIDSLKGALITCFTLVTSDDLQF